MKRRGSFTTGKPHKNKRELAERIDATARAMGLHAGNKEFDPVERLAIIGMQAEDSGDVQVAVVCYKEYAQYVRPKLAPMQHVEEADRGMEIEEKKERLTVLLDNMGVNVEPASLSDRADALATRLGITYEDARERVEADAGTHDLKLIDPPGDD